MKLVPTRMSGVLPVAACLLVLAVPSHASAKDCKGADAKPRGSKALRATTCLLNAERAKAGLAALAPNAQLRRAAQAHSADMVANGYFDHVSPTGSTLITRVTEAGYIDPTKAFQVSENLGWGSGRLATPRAVVQAWLASPGHRANLMTPEIRDVGVGIASGVPMRGAGATYTVDFGVSR